MAKASKKVKVPKIDGAEMQALRKKLGLNQKDFWSKVGVTQSGGSRYESGRTIPTPVKRLIYIFLIAAVGMTDDEEAVLDAIK